MSRGEYLSLEEARNAGQVTRFCKEHPSKGDKGKFLELIVAMAKKNSTDDQTCGPDCSAC